MPTYKENTLLQYPPDLGDTSVHPGAIEFKFFQRENLQSSSPVQTIHLYMPEQAEAPSSVSWDSMNLGLLGSSAVNGARGSEPITGLRSAMSAGGAAAANMTSEVFKNLGLIGANALANIGATAVGLLGGNATAQGLMQQVGGVTPNPYMTVLFKSLDLRDFAFKFTFYPFQQSDCETIHNIISSFRQHSLPSFGGNTETVANETPGTALFTLPNECQIRYMWKGKDNKWLPKFKRAVCTYMNTDYTGQGMYASMRNGFPAEIVMMTKWREVQVVTRQDIQGGY